MKSNRIFSLTLALLIFGFLAVNSAHAIDWTVPWREEGRQEGRQEGEATLLLHLLRRKFGQLDPVIEGRVYSAEAAQLLQWGERVLAADTLDEVFDGTRG